MRGAPDILCEEGCYTIVVEGSPVCRVGGRRDAVLVWAMSHILFAQMPNKAKKFFFFVERFVLDITEPNVPVECLKIAKYLGFQ